MHFSIQVKQLLKNNEKGHVIATCRNPTGARGLLELKNQFAERLNILPLDVTVESTIEVNYLILFLPLYSFVVHIRFIKLRLTIDTSYLGVSEVHNRKIWLS